MLKTSAPLPLARLPGLLSMLLDDLASFLDLKLALFRRELWEEGQSLLTRVLGIAIAAVFALAGFMVLICALVLALNLWLQNLLVACLIVGGSAFVGGTAIAAILARRLSHPVLRKSQIELDKDRRWIKSQNIQS
jgi:uncharacterized membrane protein YqjE